VEILDEVELTIAAYDKNSKEFASKFMQYGPEEFLEIHGLNCVRKVRQNYKEQDGSNTVDIFSF
jgi:hypothetical protein